MKKGSIVFFLFVLIFTIGVSIGVIYFYFYNYNFGNDETEQLPPQQDIGEGILKSYTNLKIIYPVGRSVEIAEKRVPMTMIPLEMAETLMEEYIRISTDLIMGVLPEGIALNNVFLTEQGILYLNFSKALVSNFQGDITDEFILLKSIFDTIVSNMDVEDVVILVDSKMTDSLGGHFLINRPLKHILTQELRVEEPG
jgi:hypothetical protein